MLKSRVPSNRSWLTRRRVRWLAVALAGLTGLYVAAGFFGLLASSTQSYSDVPSSDAAYPHVERLHDRGVFTGTECGTKKLCPGTSIDRSTTAVWIVRTIDTTTPRAIRSSKFVDVLRNDLAAPYIEELARRSITSGCGNDSRGRLKFCPDNKVPRKHMAIFLTRAFNLPAAPDAGFRDVRRGSTYSDAINRVANLGITVGCGDGRSFCPDRQITRWEAAIMLGRALEWRDGPIRNPPGARRDITPPTISITINDRLNKVTAISHDRDLKSDSWRWHQSVLEVNCEINSYYNTMSKRGSGRTVTLTAREVARNRTQYVCFRVTDKAGNNGYDGRRVLIQDNTPPSIVVSFDRSANRVTARSSAPDLKPNSWRWFIGFVDADCQTASLYESSRRNRGLRLGRKGSGSTITLISDEIRNNQTNNMYVCFRASDNAGNHGYRRKVIPRLRVPRLTPDRTAPDISATFNRSNNTITASSSAADLNVDSWRWFISEARRDCSSAGSYDTYGIRASGQSFSVELNDDQKQKNQTRRLHACFKVADTTGNVKHKALTISRSRTAPRQDSTPPVIRIALDGNLVTASTAATDVKANSWLWAVGTPRLDCNNDATYWRTAKRGSGRSVTLTEQDRKRDRLVCFRVSDTSGNKGYGNKAVARRTTPPAQRNNRTPSITVRLERASSRDDRHTLRATANETVNNWQYVSLGFAQACSVSGSFLNNSRVMSGSQASLSVDDNNRRYCFRAQNQAGNWGMGEYRVPRNLVSNVAPTITLASSNFKSSPRTAIFTSNRSVKYSLSYRLTNTPETVQQPCQENYGRATVAYKTRHTITLNTPSGKVGYYCLRGVDRQGRVGYSKPFVDDRQSPTLVISEATTVSTRQTLSVRWSDSSGLKSVVVYKQSTTGNTCTPFNSSKHTSLASLRDRSPFVILLNSGDNYLLCATATDVRDNTSTAQRRVIAATRDNSQSGGDHTLGSQFEWAKEKYANKAANDYTVSADFKLATEISPQAPQLLGFELFVPPPKLGARGIGVFSVDYNGVDNQAVCTRSLFEGKSQSNSGLNMTTYFKAKTTTDVSIRRGVLPLPTLSAGQYVCVKVKLVADRALSNDAYPVKIFVAKTPISAPSDGQLILRPMELSYAHSHAPDHYNDHFRVYVGSDNLAGRSAATRLKLVVNMPGKYVRTGSIDLDSHQIQKVYYRYRNSRTDCNQTTFKPVLDRRNVRSGVLRMPNDIERVASPGQVMHLVAPSSQRNKYLCLKVSLRRLGADLLETRIFAYQIPSSSTGATSVSTGGLSGLTLGRQSQASRTLNNTSFLQATMSTNQDQTNLLVRPKSDINLVIVEASWENVALPQDVVCDETAFLDSNSVHQGAEVKQPSPDIQYCFRAQDEAGGLHYINASFTPDSLAELDAGVSWQPSGEVDVGTSGSRWLLMVYIAVGIVIALSVIAFVIFAVQSKRSQFLQ